MFYYQIMTFWITLFLMTVGYSNQFEIIIPCGPRDAEIVDLCIDSIHRYIPEARRIIVISPERYTDQAEWFDEKVYPFTGAMVQVYMNDTWKESDKIGDTSSSQDCPLKRMGWVLQQLLKLYVFRVIPDLSDHVLILDADCVFLRHIDFFNAQGIPYISPYPDVCKPYCVYIERLLGPSYVPSGYSYIGHHMLMERGVIERLLSTIETRFSKPAWQALLDACELNEGRGFVSVLSEYAVYHAYLTHESKHYEERKLNITNCGNVFLLKYLQDQGSDLVAMHYFLRPQPVLDYLHAAKRRLSDVLD